MNAHARPPLAVALALSLGAAISLGLARFSYGLLLPPMRADLQWSYLLAGAMNTANALGYFLGALVTPLLLRRLDAQRTLLIGAVLAIAALLAGAFLLDADALLLQRLLAGVGSALIFIAGGLLAARLGAAHPAHVGFLIGLYYGGTGIGIVASALLVPATIEAAAAAQAAHGWQWSWIALGLASTVAAIGMMWAARHVDGSPVPAAQGEKTRHFALSYGLLGYLMFGVGYIGYMTFVVALLREQGMAGGAITAFYALLGCATIAGSRIWARMLDRFRGGESLAILNGLLGCATLVPVLTTASIAVFISGIVFGAVFLSAVASTTAMVRHNLPASAWSSGIGMFTTVFAFGQIAGPTAVGWIADGPGGLARGLVFSAGALFLGSLLAWRQKPLH